MVTNLLDQHLADIDRRIADLQALRTTPGLPAPRPVRPWTGARTSWFATSSKACPPGPDWLQERRTADDSVHGSACRACRDACPCRSGRGPECCWCARSSPV
ncbi:hypothetical protein ACFV9D_27125 [Streptomyces sp. NPDC059875]|uniref:hypothetical protein n=1 Tax=unclassified Streptomyces TaxID=2593676 RepID=UPI003667CCD7